MSDELIDQAKKYLSDIRLFRYGRDNSIDMYFDNLIISEIILSMISIFEVILRNKINAVLINQYGGDYLTNSSLSIFNSKEKGIIKSAIKATAQAKVKILEGRILAELTFGFWCRLTKRHNLWLSCLHKIHPVRKNIKFKIFSKRIKLISDIRNKIAHHERILKKRPYNIKDILSVITEETLLIIDGKDRDFKQYIKNFFHAKSIEVQRIINKHKSKNKGAVTI